MHDLDTVLFTCVFHFMRCTICIDLDTVLCTCVFCFYKTHTMEQPVAIKVSYDSCSHVTLSGRSGGVCSSWGWTPLHPESYTHDQDICATTETEAKTAAWSGLDVAWTYSSQSCSGYSKPGCIMLAQLKHYILQHGSSTINVCMLIIKIWLLSQNFVFVHEDAVLVHRISRGNISSRTYFYL